MDNTFVAEGAYRHFGVIFSSIDWRRCSEYKGIICNRGGGGATTYTSHGEAYS